MVKGTHFSEWFAVLSTPQKKRKKRGVKSNAWGGG